MSTLKNAKSRRKLFYHPPETVISPAGYSYVTQETVISPSRAYVLHTNLIGFEIKRRSLGAVCSILFDMSSRATIPEYQPRGDQKPWCVLSSFAFGIGWHKAPGLSCHLWAYSGMSSPKPCDTCLMSKITTQIQFFLKLYLA